MEIVFIFMTREHSAARVNSSKWLSNNDNNISFSLLGFRTHIDAINIQLTYEPPHISSAVVQLKIELTRCVCECVRVNEWKRTKLKIDQFTLRKIRATCSKCSTIEVLYYSTIQTNEYFANVLRYHWKGSIPWKFGLFISSTQNWKHELFTNWFSMQQIFSQIVFIVENYARGNVNFNMLPKRKYWILKIFHLSNKDGPHSMLILFG